MSPPKTPSRLRPIAPSREEKQASQEGRKAGRPLNTQEEIDALPLLDITKPIYVAGHLLRYVCTLGDGYHHIHTYGRTTPNGAFQYKPLTTPPASNYAHAMCAADVIRLHAAATSSLPAFLPSCEATRPGDMAQTSECDADLANLATWEKFGMILMIGISGTISGWVLFSLSQWVVRLAHKTGFPL